MTKKHNIKKLIFYILTPLILGMIVGKINMGNNDIYAQLIKPDFMPPSYVYGIVWTVLYLLMGYSAYLISISNLQLKNEALYIYYLQLAVNLAWPYLFFNQGMILFSFIWIMLLIVIVFTMVKLFYQINKKSGLINIPYIIWLFFAGYLNYTLYILNK